MNNKLKDTGEKLDVDGEDIEEIKKEKKREKLKKTVIGIILSILVLCNITMLLKLLEGSSPSGSSYPYGAAVLPSILVARDKDSVSLVVATILMLSITVVLFSTLYMMMPKYGVFSREELEGKYELPIG